VRSRGAIFLFCEVFGQFSLYLFLTFSTIFFCKNGLPEFDRLANEFALDVYDGMDVRPVGK
jgi:hypothetical protein